MNNATFTTKSLCSGTLATQTGQESVSARGSFVFGPGNVDLQMHVGQTFGDNAPPADFAGRNQGIRAM
jgi:hypothetical protein